jgi:membrane protein
MSADVRPEIPPGGKAERPQQIPRRGWQQILKRSWAQTQADQVPLLGAGVAFFGFLALFPTLIALVLAYGLFADPATIAAQVQSMGAALPPDVQKLITDQVLAQSQKTGALSIGLIISLVIALWSASGGVANLVQAINTAYDETDNRTVIKKRLLALGLTIGAIVFMIVLVTLIALLPIVFAFIEASSLRWVVQIIRWVLIALLIMVALAVLYRLAPARTAAKLAWTSPGAIVATVVWLLVSAGFSLYVTLTANSGYAKTYGALAGIVVLLIWLWLTSYAVLLGAEVNAESERQTLVDTTVGPDRPVGQRGATAADDKNLNGTADGTSESPAEDPTAEPAEAAEATSTPSGVEDLETDLVATRGRLASNVGALAAKADLKTQAKKKAAETTRRVVAEVEAKARRSPGAVAALAAGAGLVVGLLARRGRGA